MKKIMSFIKLVLIASLSMAQTQDELNNDAKNKYDLAGKELTQVYNNILKEYKSDTTFIKNLKNSQKLWIQFRDAEMKVKFPDHRPGYYGSVIPMCWSLYKEGLIWQRITVLKAWLVGTEEGDVCSGSIKIKDE